MPDTVTIQSALFDDPRYTELTPSQRASLPLLVRLVEQYGTDGILDLRRKTIWHRVGLGPKTYEDLILKMDLWGWGCETEQGRLMLCGPLAPVSSPGTFLNGPEGDLQKRIDAAVEAALTRVLPVVLETAVPAIVKANAAAVKAEQRLNKQQDGVENVQDKPTSEAADVQDKEVETGGDVQDTEPASHTRGESIDSNRVDIDSIKSYSSIDSIDSNSIEGEPPPTATIPPELVPADIAQRIVERSPNPDGSGRIEMPRALALLEKYGAPRCLEVLLMIPSRKPGKPGAFIEAALLNKQGKYPVPPEIVAEAKRLTSPSVPKPPRAMPAESEETRIQMRIGILQDAMTDEERQEVDEQTLARLAEPFRGDYQRATEEQRTPSHQARAEFKAARLLVLREWALRGSDGPNTSQGG